MQLKTLLEKLEKSEIFKNFKNKNPDAFLCAGFFILNLKAGTAEYNLDFRNEEDIFTFKIPEIGINEDIKLLTDKLIKDPAAPKPFDKLDLSKPNLEKIKLDINELSQFVSTEIWSQQIKNPLEELIAVIQSKANSIIWTLTCICAGFTIVTMEIDALKKQVTKFEKKSMFDFVKVKKKDEL